MNDSTGGRPSYSDETFRGWLEAMRPFLVNGSSLWHCIERAGLETHSFTIYEKYRRKDWFSQRIDKLRAAPGESVNEAFTILVRNITDKVKRGEIPTKDEVDTMKFFGEKHRSSQPFFVNRTETAQARPIEDIVADLEKSDNVDDVAREAKEQMVAAQPPVQNQG